MQTLALVLTLLAAGQVESPPGTAVDGTTAATGIVLPRSAIAPLRAAISTDATGLDGRLVLGSALVEESTVTVSYRKRDGIEPVITVVLGHPSQKADGVRAGPFVILSHKGDDEAAVAALVVRLSRLGADQIWRAEVLDDPAEDTADADQVVAPKPETEAERRTRRLLARADHALLLGDTEAATGHLAALWSEPELAPDMLLDLAERFQRVKAPDQVSAALARWKSRTLNDITSPIASARAVVLGAGESSVLKVLQDARVSGNVCGFEKLATSMDAMGNRVEAYQFLDTAARKTNCPDVAATMLEWLAVDGRVSEATQLSEILIQHAPDNHRVAAVRASMLLAAGQPQTAVDLLEPLVMKAPVSDLLGTYVHARLLLVEGEGELAALADRSDAHIEDTLTALTAAAAHHRHGQDQAAARYLARASDTYADHPTAALLQARLAFDLGDRTTAGRLLAKAEELDHDDPRAHIERYALQGELLRWSDPPAARAALRRAVLLGARQSRGPDPGVRRLKAQAAALDACIEDGSEPPCPGPFLHPRDHDANTALEDADDGTSGVFGNWLTIFGVLVIFLVIVRQGRMNRQRSSRWN